ncbi:MULTISPECIES: peptidoglycan-binding protein [Streptomyces]|uniref:Peptidoglycan-binding domain-containing protein n=1 Tax=Streptomyces glycanivorans TaxID=3033808 RepID=A0ABY9J4N9_9ACTN|nr:MULTISPECIES: peptidoglycan-binding domain-containing protein [unclassified Streptomyces]WSQ75667.1 peptidoglycan-binding protein [Streptomyces sp. NBC_01213]TXS12802.1 peptidoglycan-binding protein [Streptomyces sp. wa22]WLQ62155.1 peptidoglycan-binding domain-containing protein [Streptomyces sp. Alt3]WSQ82912.1 peptidoglycan-binding protein [Streptomyces sp. NBC_01212]WSR04591.1 peptidoglycan-binding protein [Streptomyces sp. NBC_01208]
MRWRKTAVTLGLVGVLSVPAVGVSTAAPAAPQAAAAVSCRLLDFIGYYCGYHLSNTRADRGDSGAKVQEFQALLIFKGFSVGSTGVDGQFGPSTQSAVKRFQSSRGITADGIVGPTTWHYLRTPGL